MARKTFSTVFEEIGAATERRDKISLLRQQNNEPMRTLLQYALSPSIKLDVEVPSYKENVETDGYSANSLYVESRRLYIFNENYTKVTKERKAVLLAQILESVDKSDAVLLSKVIQRDLSEYGLDASVVNEAYPGLVK